jgi:hypothetical protein
MGRLSRTFYFMRASFDVLKKDKELLFFPVLSGISCLLVLATFIVPFFLGAVAENLLGTLGSVGALAVAFGYYTATYTVVFFFNTAVIGCAVKRLRGGDPTVGDGFSIAFGRLPQIIGWAMISATVGMILNALEQHKVLGRIASLVLGAAWNLTTFFAVPILVVEGKGPIDALRESAALLKSTWGGQVAGNFSFGLLFFLVFVLCGGIVYLGAASGNGTLLIACVAVAAIGLLVFAVIQSALYAIFQAAMYLHVRGEESIDGFDKDQLTLAMMMR